MTNDIDVTLLRTRLEATARRERDAQIKAKRRGLLLEKLLKTVNGPAYHYMSVQLQPGQEVADILVNNEVRILDLFLAPLGELAGRAATSDVGVAPQNPAPERPVVTQVSTNAPLRGNCVKPLQCLCITNLHPVFSD